MARAQLAAPAVAAPPAAQSVSSMGAMSASKVQPSFDGGEAGHAALAALLSDDAPAAAAPAPAAPTGAVISWYDTGYRLDGSSSAPAAPAAPAVPLEERVARAMLSGEEAAAMAKLLILESSFDATPQAVNDALIGSWKLLVASDADGVRKCGLAGVPSSKYERACRVVGHFQVCNLPQSPPSLPPFTALSHIRLRACHIVAHLQSFRQPDPMDILNGKADQPLLATTEVAIDTKDGSTFSATVEGGFAVGSLSSSTLHMRTV